MDFTVPVVERLECHEFTHKLKFDHDCNISYKYESSILDRTCGSRKLCKINADGTKLLFRPTKDGNLGYVRYG